MKKIITALVFVLCVQHSFAQDADEIKKADVDKYSKPSRDYVMLQLGYNTWLNPPTDSVKLKDRGMVINTYVCYDFPIKKSNFSFAAGAGFGTSSIYLNKYHMPLKDTNAYVHFVPDNSTDSSKRYKILTGYLDFPFELRYFQNKLNRNKGFKAALGIKAGTLVDVHTKSIQIANGTNASVILKQNSRRYFEKSRIMATARIGWGNFSIFANYQLNQQFTTGNPYSPTPFNLGICLSGL